MIEYILLDVEGTTTDIDFVHKTLFPYSEKHLEFFVKNHLEDAEVQECLVSVQETVKSEEDREIMPEEAIDVLKQWIDEDRKHTALKTLQGLIWKEGFEKGEFQAHVYDDVPEMFRHWRDQKVRMGIYSSGSVQAQQLLFRYSVHGDLRHFLSHYFDTNIGGKKEPGSYKAIAERIKLPPEKILFVSDSVEELKAAREAGLSVVQSCRDPESVRSMMYDMAASFREIKLSGSQPVV